MGGLRMLTSCFNPNQRSRTTGASKERVESLPTNPPAKAGSSHLGPGLQRVESDPAKLPSNTPKKPEIKTARHSTTRMEPDAFPPMHFGRSPARAKFLGIPLPFSKSSTTEGSKRKAEFLEKKPLRFTDIERIIKNSHPDLMKIVKEYSPRYNRLPEHLRCVDMEEALKGHPKYMAVTLEYLNEKARLPTVATATRTMTPVEHKFLAGAFKRISEDVRDNEFHIHGESAIIGDKRGKITHFHHEPKGSVKIPLARGDKYNLHTHPPFNEPATSVASRSDHIFAAESYFRGNNKIHSYVTNGKDVLHIQPDSTELVKLLPNPKMEQKLGKFPVAFTVPKPAPRPYPFSNHEAPGTL